MRGRVWPLLLGVDVQLSPEAEAEYLELRCAKHRDSSVVECDVQRSLWTYTDGEQALVCLCLCCILPAYHSPIGLCFTVLAVLCTELQLSAPPKS